MYIYEHKNWIIFRWDSEKIVLSFRSSSVVPPYYLRIISVSPPYHLRITSAHIGTERTRSGHGVDTVWVWLRG